ncbi:VOC family protein [Ferrovibrio sp.]|uniref:VOC family protein n=1 Tax=Ferrovibrio sp. TaxID=1917215 RepID=UPI0035AF8378
MPEARPPFSLGGFDHIVLRSADPARLIRFYCDVLGCSIAHEQPKIGLTHLRVGTQLIDIVDAHGSLAKPGDEPLRQAARNLDHFCLTVQPFDEAAIRAHLARFGIAPEAAKDRYGAYGTGTSLYLSDPDGNGIELKGR